MKNVTQTKCYWGKKVWKEKNLTLKKLCTQNSVPLVKKYYEDEYFNFKVLMKLHCLMELCIPNVSLVLIQFRKYYSKNFMCIKMEYVI